MHILLTGASSFTGFWFAGALAEAGHRVTACLAGPDTPEHYAGVRATRIGQLKDRVHTLFDTPFGSDAFLAEIARSAPFDLLCHHWAEVRDYRSPDFDAVAALGANTHRLVAVLRALKAAGAARLVLTGSVFEQKSGVGNAPLRAFSPYGLSKGLTAELCAYYCPREGIALDRFIIPNPFGPYEEPRFTDYLMKNWFAGNKAQVSTPRYVRDNIPVDLLAKAYAGFAGRPPGPGGALLGPTGYVESQGAFALRVAREMCHRLSLACELDLANQTAFPEPEIRINTDFPDWAALGWVEGQFWDAFARYYDELYGGARA
jgi:nucleoside-diphosphate-sugar epimerase